MLLPEKIDHSMYSKLIQLSVSSSSSAEGELIIGNYTTEGERQNSSRILQSLEQGAEEEAEGIQRFNYSVISQSLSKIDF